MQPFDPRRNVLHGIVKGARHRIAHGLKQKYAPAPSPNLEAHAKQPVPGVDEEGPGAPGVPTNLPPGQALDEGEPHGDALQRILEQMLAAKH